MEKAIIEKKLCTIAFFSIFVLLDICFALSVDISKHNCNHEHPKHHEVSGLLSPKAKLNSICMKKLLTKEVANDYDTLLD